MKITHKIRRTTYWFMQFRLFRFLAKTPIAFGNLLRKEYKNYTADKKKEIDLFIWEKYLNNNLEVLEGPFKGLKYPAFKSYTSSMLPKLLGTYESEIHEDLNRIINKEFDCILNIGAAEGYFAVGMALCCPETLVVSYDINPEAIEACRVMAELNNAKNLKVNSYFDTNEFNKYLDKEIFIFCDIDGFEIKLFNKKNIPLLKRATLIIETHDYLDASITSTLIDNFKHSHSIKCIPWSPNKISETPEILKKASKQIKIQALKERIVDNKWLIVEPNS